MGKLLCSDPALWALGSKYKSYTPIQQSEVYILHSTKGHYRFLFSFIPGLCFIADAISSSISGVI